MYISMPTLYLQESRKLGGGAMGPGADWPYMAIGHCPGAHHFSPPPPLHGAGPTTIVARGPRVEPVRPCMGLCVLGSFVFNHSSEYSLYDVRVSLLYIYRTVVPKLGAMALQGARRLLPGSHGRILKKYICQGLVLKNGLFDFLEIFTH